MTLRQVDQNIWVAEQPLTMLGVRYGARMTVIRLAEGSGSDLVVISPIRLTPDLMQKVNQLGSVKWLIAPNSFHHLYMLRWTEAFPKASLLTVPELTRKRPDLKATCVMDENFSGLWGKELKALHLAGGPQYSETVFYHAPTRTLIVTDLFFYFPQVSGLWQNIAHKVYGTHGRLAQNRALKLLVRNKAGRAAGLKRMSEWDFNRVIMAHGEICEHDAAAKVAAAL